MNNKMAKVEAKTKENPKLQQSTLSDGRISLYLEYYLGRTQWVDEETGKIKVKHDRKKETLNMYLVAKPRTPEERQLNKETLELAKQIRIEREQGLKAAKTGKRIAVAKKVNFLEYFQTYIDKVTTKKRNAERYSDRIELQGFQSCFRLFVKPSQSPLKPNQDAATLLVRNHARNGDKRTRITKQGVKD